MNFVFQKQALDEYREVVAYIAQSSDQNAHRFIERVEAEIATFSSTQNPAYEVVMAH